MSSGSRPQYLAIGWVARPWGVAGILKVEILSDFPERFLGLTRVYIQGEARAVEESRLHQGMALVRLTGYSSRTQAEELRGALLEVPMEEVVPLPPGKYYVHEIVGLEAWTPEGRFLGRVSEVLRTGSNDVYVVEGAGGELLIPALEGVVLEVDLAEGKILVQPQPMEDMT